MCRDPARIAQLARGCLSSLFMIRSSFSPNGYLPLRKVLM